ncbi:hypothetical protein PoB_006089900 [Plakobranchus ocellatus]|uniref:Uncharacterized protein n=1 Tax=Plakobranchus ocellatus TaxID=259542 RepID=A0AAV4CRA8_9GAST|nr:hypothetical protein PoB_006089900 [Plakobranchus ocellatus]
MSRGQLGIKTINFLAVQKVWSAVKSALYQREFHLMDLSVSAQKLADSVGHHQRCLERQKFSFPQQTSQNAPAANGAKRTTKVRKQTASNPEPNLSRSRKRRKDNRVSGSLDIPRPSDGARSDDQPSGLHVSRTRLPNTNAEISLCVSITRLLEATAYLRGKIYIEEKRTSNLSRERLKRNIKSVRE